MAGAALSWDGKNIVVSTLAEGSQAATDGLEARRIRSSRRTAGRSLPATTSAPPRRHAPTKIVTDTGKTFAIGPIEGFYTKLLTRAAAFAGRRRSRQRDEPALLKVGRLVDFTPDVLCSPGSSAAAAVRRCRPGAYTAGASRHRADALALRAVAAE